METIYGAYRTVTSRSAQKTYLKTFLFGFATLVLLAFAATSYIILYMNYIPQKGLSRVVHLQYSTRPGVNPTGALFLDALVPSQSYTITATLTAPTTPTNIEIGNFMLFLSFYSTPNPPASALSDHYLLARSQRPAILTYHSPLLQTLQTLLKTPLFLTGLSRQQETLTIPLFESITFPDTPKSARIEIAAEKLGVYDLKLEFYANFTGLRWVMYSHKILSFLVFTGTFFVISVVCAGITFQIVSSRLGKIEGVDEGSSVSEEDAEGERSEGLEQRQFYTRGTGLRYPSPSPTPEVEGLMTPESGASVPGTVMGEDADDEDEEGGLVDIGGSLGTQSTARSAAAARRRIMVSRPPPGGR
ncbi:putative tubulin--tyrosine ligase pby1 [Rhizina undulata]